MEKDIVSKRLCVFLTQNLLAQVAEFKVSSGYGEVWLILAGLKFKDVLAKSGPCSFCVFRLPAWLPENAHKFFTKGAGLSFELLRWAQAWQAQ
eukprot:1146148-Pelagomonas_calceolata.AAC.3